MKVEIRKPFISDAKRFYEILNNPNFTYFTAKPKTVKAEKEWLRNLLAKWSEGKEFCFAVLANDKVVGGAGIIISNERNREHTCNLGYFVDKAYWGKGIATKAVRLLEKYIQENYDLFRIQIIMAKENIGSQKVAIKAGYKKEGLMRKSLKIADSYHDSYLYAKLLR